MRWVVPPRLGGWTDPHRLYEALGGTAPLPAARTPPAKKKSSKATTKPPIATAT
ncbi:hypothetical protein LE181_02220 [Streptomyces sp. SCA3-4]|uniref:hypothetical protein n=1 Tax=Streptomyces sichuanensis TaxID=2871810 RepID=UPI001CE2BA1A|nr:hypothetical protein [Streptomyces sichuanensis]MCA6090991.1 hypothetical protein [Streptomyces sichuanensis]